MQILIDIDESIAELLKRRVEEINQTFKAQWSESTLAASFVEHVLMDDLQTDILQ